MSSMCRKYTLDVQCDTLSHQRDCLISYSDVGSNLGTAFLNVAIHQWSNPDISGETTCARAMSHPLPIGAHCYWGQTLSQDAFTGQLM